MPHFFGLGAALKRPTGGFGEGSPLTQSILRELGPGVPAAMGDSPLMDVMRSGLLNRSRGGGPISILQDPEFVSRMGALLGPQQSGIPFPAPPPAPFSIFSPFLSNVGLFGGA